MFPLSCVPDTVCTSLRCLIDSLLTGRVSRRGDQLTAVERELVLGEVTGLL